MTGPQGRAVVYRYKDGLYVNLTNRCPTACRFCVKFSWKMRYRDYDLKLGRREPSVDEVLDAMSREHRARPFREIVFCGYGESTYRLEDMLRVCEAASDSYPKASRRLNTIGLGDLINRRAISAELSGRMDSVSVSLNTADPAQWERLHAPLPEFRERGFVSVLDFIRACAAAVEDTVVTAVSQPDIDLPACRERALSLGAKFRERPWLEGSDSQSPRP